MNNIFQHMREGRSADEVLFGEKTPTEKSSFDRLYDRELPLPAGRMVKYVNPNTNGHMDYRVHKVISNEGSCGIIYMMNTPQHGEYVVMKEFCPKALNTYRYTNRVVDDYDSTNTVEELVDGNTEEKVYQNYQLHYDSNNDVIDVFQKFKEEPGRILGLLDDPNAEDAEQRFKDMNLAHPFTGCFEWQGNHYYLCLREFKQKLSRIYPFIISERKARIFAFFTDIYPKKATSALICTERADTKPLMQCTAPRRSPLPFLPTPQDISPTTPPT